MQTATTIRFDAETLDQLNTMASTLGRPRDWVIAEAVKRYLEYEVWSRQEVQVGLNAVAEGRTVSHEEVKRCIRQLGIHVD